MVVPTGGVAVPPWSAWAVTGASHTRLRTPVPPIAARSLVAAISPVTRTRVGRHPRRASPAVRPGWRHGRPRGV